MHDLSAFQIDPSGQKPAIQAAIDRRKCIAQSKPSIAHGFIGHEQIRTQALEADESGTSGRPRSSGWKISRPSHLLLPTHFRTSQSCHSLAAFQTVQPTSAMAQNDVAEVASGKAPVPATPPKGAESNVFDLSPSTEAAVPEAAAPEADKAKADGPPPALMNAIPAFMHTMVHQSFAEDLLPDWETLGPDAFPNRRTWVARGLTLPGQPSKDIRVIDILGDGTHVDRGEAAFEQANPLLQTAFPEGSGVCRVIIGVPELGKVDREFAMRAVNLPGERILGSDPDGVFEQSHFRSRVCPAFDLARLRNLWVMEDVAWKPFWLPIASMRTPTEKPGPAPTPTEGAVRASGRDVLYFHLSFAVVQTIPLQGDKFLCKSTCQG